MIELHDFCKNYGDFTAVDHLNLKIEAGEMFGFIGPNGAGKSTTIRFLATLLKASHGEGTVNGHSVTRRPLDVRRSVGYMPDNFGVYDGMKVWEFLDFFAVAYQIPRSKRKQVIGDVLELLDLTHNRDDYVNGLSRGMKQRLCLAKTLVHDPPVLILDEPSSGLDPLMQQQFAELVREHVARGGSVLLSSHVLAEVQRIADRVGVLRSGRLIAVDRVADLLARSLHRVRATFADDVAESEFAGIRGVRDLRVVDHAMTCHAPESALDEVLKRVAVHAVRDFECAETELEEAFLTYYGSDERAAA